MRRCGGAGQGAPICTQSVSSACGASGGPGCRRAGSAPVAERGAADQRQQPRGLLVIGLRRQLPGEPDRLGRQVDVAGVAPVEDQAPTTLPLFLFHER
jgi:hypothetical protein